MENEIKEIKNQLEEIEKQLKQIREEAIKIEHLEEYAQSSNFPALIGIILLQLLTIFLLGWMMFKQGLFF